MKNILLAFLLIPFLTNAVLAQCPGCIINTACTDATPGTRLPNLCPSTLPNGTVGVAYSEDITIWLPQTFTYSGIDITLLNVSVTSVTNLPAGLSLETSMGPVPLSFSVTGDMRLCARICGTPTVPGTKTIQLNVTVLVNTPIGTQSQNQSFPIPITINAPAGGNASFSFNAAFGCDSLTDTFHALLSNPPYPVNYRWDFGNDGTIDDTTQNPAPVFYNTPGEHYVKLTTEFLNYRITEVAVNNLNDAPWYWQQFCGDGTGFTLFGIPLYTQVSDADLAFQLTDGTNVYNGGEITDNDAPVWTFASPFNPVPGVINISFREVDPGICGGDENGGVATITFINAPRTYNFSTIGGEGTISGRLKIETYVESVIETIDTIIIYSSPAVPVLTANKDSFCSNDSVLLYVATPVDGNSIEWFKDSTSLIGITDSAIWVKDPGAYRVTLTNSNGCSSTSASKYIYKFSSPPTNLIVIQIPGRKIVNSNFPGAGFTIQWYLDGNPISGVTSYILDATADGVYTCTVYNTDYAACAVSSAPYNFSSVGINDNTIGISNIKVFPNPAQDVVSIAFDMYESQDVKIQMTDMVGKLVYEFNQSDTETHFEKTIPIHSLSQGVYALQVHVGNQTIQKRIIKH